MKSALIVHSSSTEQYAKELAKQYREVKFWKVDRPPERMPDIMNGMKVIGVGGGSVLDTAKLLAKPNSCIAIPTTAAGAAATPYATIWLKDRKISVRTAKPVIEEYKGEINLPAQVRQSTTFDCLAHAIESLWFADATAESKTLSIWSIMSIGLAKNDNELVRIGNVAGKAIAIACTNIVHATSYPLTLRYGIEHGTALSMLLPHFVEFMDFDPLNCLLGKGGKVEQILKYIKGFYKVPLPKKDIDSEVVVRDVFKNYKDKMSKAPKKIARKDLIEILEKV